MSPKPGNRFPRREHWELIARTYDPGAIVDPFRLEIAVAGHDPRWRELERLDGPLPVVAVEALKPAGDRR